MILRNFQSIAVKKILNRSEDLFLNGGNKKLIFKSPTGSGKTLMIADFLKQFSEKHSNMKISIIWAAPRKLHNQSKEKLSNYFKNTNSYICSNFNELKRKKISDREILFLNWEAINKKDKNLLILENEKEFYFGKVLENTKNNGNKLMMIIDESHYHATSDISKKLIKEINPELTIEMSATPILQNPDEIVTVPIETVKLDGMIKKSIILNPGFKNILKNNKIYSNNAKTSDLFILDQAIKKRNEIANEYKKLNNKINPLLLIQLPDKKTQQEEKLKIDIQKYLKDHHKISTENGKLAIHLSENKRNLNSIKKNDNEVEVLIFKQAIALGWDCPRAQILALFRDWKTLNFSIQTLGRIIRMPQVKIGHYRKEILNHSYVFTNIENIEIKEDTAKDYVTINTSFRDKKVKLGLNSVYRVRQREKTRLNPSFTNIFLSEAENYKLEKKIKLNNQKVEYKLISDEKSFSIDQLIDKKYSGTQNITNLNLEDLQKVFDYFVRNNLSPYFPEDVSVGRVKESIYKFFNKKLKIKYENSFEKIINIVLSKYNQQHFVNIIDITKEKYKFFTDKRDQEIGNIKNWNIPDLINYTGNYVRFNSKKSIMQPFYYDSKWKSEENFIKHLDKSSSVKWWYQNGENDNLHFAIPYNENNDVNLFFVDFIVCFKNNKLGFFDTKSGRTIDDAKFKSDGLQSFILKNKKNFVGGLVTNSDQSNYKGRWLVFDANGKDLNSKDLKKWKNLNF